MSDLWFHGSDKQIKRYCPESGSSDGPGLMFFSASCNVACRYGSRVVTASIPVEGLQRISVEDWLMNEMPDCGDDVGFIVTGELGSFDFPVDTLVLTRDPGCSFALLGADEVMRLDDGRAYEEPTRPGDREWSLFLEDILCGEAGDVSGLCQA